MAARKDRIKSAQPCLNRDAERLEAKEANESKKDEPVSRASSSMRVQSARERKLSQEASHVFPNELSSPSQVGARWKTIYKEDYESKTSTRPSSARPTSPTRRNNPHPRQSFLTWKVPSRRLSRDEDDGVDPIRLQERLEEFEADVSEDFQRDYKDSRNDGAANNEVLTTLVKLPLPIPGPESREYGRRLSQPSPGRLPAAPKRIEVQPAMEMVDSLEVKGEPVRKPERKTMPVTKQAIETTVKSEHLSAVDNWLKSANQREQNTVLSMLKSAEDSQIERAVSRTLQPHTIPAVQQWLKEAKPEDRSVAVRLLNAISPATGTRPVSRGKQRRASVPVGFDPQSSSQAAARQLYRRHSVPDNLTDSKNKPPAALWHLNPFRNHPPKVVHQGSVFGSAPGYRGSHFVIHPEWPEYV